MQNEGLYAKIETEKGDILLSLEYEKAPMTVANFVGLVEGSLNHESPDEPFYDGLNFHRVIQDFMIQGGCPKGTGTGGPGYTFPDEFEPSLRHDKAGILSMANSGPDTNGSQFFITHGATPWLDDKHTVFGHVVEGQDVVDSIEQGDRIDHIEIFRNGETAKSFVIDKQSFTEQVAKSMERKREQEAKKQGAVQQEIENRWPEATITTSGLRYIITEKGSGQTSPKKGQTVTVHYTGSLLSGQVFDSSVKRGQPAQFAIGQVIEGWNEALVEMKKGEKRTLIIPPELGYGQRGYPGVIPPNSYLVFDVELLDF